MGTETLLSQLPTRSLLSPSQGWPSRVSAAPVPRPLPSPQEGCLKQLPYTGHSRCLQRAEKSVPGCGSYFWHEASEIPASPSVPPSSPQASPSLLFSPFFPSVHLFASFLFLFWYGAKRSSGLHSSESVYVCICPSVRLCLCVCLCVPTSI